MIYRLQNKLFSVLQSASSGFTQPMLLASSGFDVPNPEPHECV